MHNKENELYNYDYYSCSELDYSHTHGYESEILETVNDDKKNKDEKMLNILLVHWINHNESHVEGYREWIDKAKKMDKIETSKCIEKAIEYMEEVKQLFIKAKQHL